MKSDARSVAARVLVRVERDRAFAAAALSSALERELDLDARDRSLTTEIVYGALRFRGVLDAWLERHAPRGLGGLDDSVRSHLRVAAYQMLRLDRIPKPAAVSSAVEAVKRERGEKLAGFANAILRALARDTPPSEEDRVGAALPAWLFEALERDLGPEGARAIARASLEPASVTVRVNLRKTSLEELALRIEREKSGSRVAPHPAAPTALQVEGGGDLASLPSHAEGLFTVQDAAAQAVVALLAPAAGERVLDACAGRGGKTGAIVEAARDVQVDGADDQPRKLERLAAEMTRLGHAGVRAVPVDLAAGTSGLAADYDAVLLDAPCTGTGVLGRRPEIRWRLSPDDVARLAEVQRTLLDRVAQIVRPGGRIVYSVCSLLAEEGPRVVERFLSEKPSWSRTSERTWLPHTDRTDGFYAALLVRG